MDKKKQFSSEIQKAYTFQGESILLGAAMLDNTPINKLQVSLALKSFNRHGLITGATGTGKTKTLQILVEQLSLKGVPSLLMDLKGDLSGLAQQGIENSHITQRHTYIGSSYIPESFPVELLSLSKEKGIPIRATILEFGPILLSKMLSLNETQSGILSILFKYCDDHGIALIDLKDLKKTLQFFKSDGKKELEESYGSMSSTSMGAIMRKIVELEQQGADQFFGEPSFDVVDLLRTNDEGMGIISLIRLIDIQTKPKLFSTFMLSLLAEIYQTFPEQGDSNKPKLCLFIDEAHLLFDEASDALLDQIESIIKLIRSKGVGIFFCTQTSKDIPDFILSQLGLKIQHSLRAFTAKDRKNIKQISENFPITDYYKTDELITQLGIGEALVTSLNEKGHPTPLVATFLQAPKSRMGILSPTEINKVVQHSMLLKKYDKLLDRESAFEMLSKKLEKNDLSKRNRSDNDKTSTSRSQPKEASLLEKLSKNTMIRQLGRTLIRELGRGLLGAITKK